MIVVDTDHISILQYEDSTAAITLNAKLKSFPHDEIATTAITLEEQSRSWISAIGRHSDAHQQIPYYRRLVDMLDFFAKWRVLHFDERAADEYKRLRKNRVRIATTDLKIAAIALVHDAILVSRNLQDFERVPGLRIEDWIES